MFGLIEGLFSFVFGMIKMALGLAWGAVEFVFGLLGGLLSLVFSLGGFILAGVLIAVFVRRRVSRQDAAQSSAQEETRTYDVDNEEFTSFYDQFRTEQ